MFKQVTIVTGQHLLANPRVWKSANFLASRGYSVKIFTTWYSKMNIAEDIKLIDRSIEYQAAISLIYSWRNFPLVFFAKFFIKLSRICFRYLTINSVHQEVYLFQRQLKRILNSTSDLFICHQEAGLFLGVELLKKGKKVAFDFEDWYAEDYPNPYRSKSLFRKYEAFAFKNAAFITCPSIAMASTFEELYEVKSILSVLYNSFPTTDVSAMKNHKIPNGLVWFSQTIGEGRGIESFIEVMKLIEIPLELHFVGKISSGYINYLNTSLIGTPHIIRIHYPMRHSDLLSFLQQFPIGLALENSQPPSRNLTVSNKILIYLQLNMHVIATETTGQLELKDYFPASILFINQNDIMKSSQAIRNLIMNKFTTPKNSMGKFEWDVQGNLLLNLVYNSLN